MKQTTIRRQLMRPSLRLTLLGTMSALVVAAACGKSADDSDASDAEVSADDGTSAASSSGANGEGSSTSGAAQGGSGSSDPAHDDSSPGADDTAGAGATADVDEGAGGSGGVGGGGGVSDGSGGGAGAPSGAGGGQNDDSSADDSNVGVSDDGAGGVSGEGMDDDGAPNDDSDASTDDAPSDVTPEAGAPDDEPSGGCAGRDYIICEDFEAASIGGIPDEWTAHGEPLGVTDAQAHHGSQSLELGARINWERRIYHDASALGGNHYGRIYFKVQQPVPDAFVHSTLVALHGVGPTTGAGEFRVVDTVKQAVDTPDVASLHQYLYNVQPENGAEFGYGGPYTRPFDDQWHCVEYHIDDATQSYTLWVNGEEEISFENGAGNYEDSDMPASYDEVRVGWTNYQDAPPGFVAWIDDVIFDDEPIGCEPLR